MPCNYLIGSSQAIENRAIFTAYIGIDNRLAEALVVLGAVILPRQRQRRAANRRKITPVKLAVYCQIALLGLIDLRHDLSGSFIPGD